MVSPYPGIAVRLQLNLHRIRLRAWLVIIRHAQRVLQLLDVMPKLVRHNIFLRKRRIRRTIIL